jgi:hypothetical protein
LNGPSGVSGSSVEGKVRRSIDINKEDKVDERGLKNLVREAVTLIQSAKGDLSRQNGYAGAWAAASG